MCELCKGCGDVKCFKGKTTIKESIDDVIVNCKDNTIPLNIILKSRGTILVDQTKQKVIFVFGFLIGVL